MDLIKIHLLATAILTGAIWVIQLIHYPVFNYIDKNCFKLFMKFHVRGILIFVLPFMLIEMISGTYLFIIGHNSILFLFSLVILYLIWISTVLIFSNYHKKLQHDKDNDIINKLVKYNWLRTIGWTVRLILICL
jgi:hypothetical protein